jgi:hypothetical protein
MAAAAGEILEVWVAGIERVIAAVEEIEWTEPIELTDGIELIEGLS